MSSHFLLFSHNQSLQIVEILPPRIERILFSHCRSCWCVGSPRFWVYFSRDTPVATPISLNVISIYVYILCVTQHIRFLKWPSETWWSSRITEKPPGWRWKACFDWLPSSRLLLASYLYVDEIGYIWLSPQGPIRRPTCICSVICVMNIQYVTENVS